MSLHLVPTGSKAPDEVNVIVEIPMGGEPIKYEVDKDSGALFVDRVLGTAMRYPCNYGYIPHTLCGDGDPADVLIYMSHPLIHGSVVRCRPIGMLKMTDESGEDAKILAVPITKITPYFEKIQEITDLPSIQLDQISHFFEHYKDLEKGKWVKIEGWADAAAAKEEIRNSIENYQQESDKPKF